MIVYVDMVFFLNVFLDFILLMSVSVILTRNVKIRRIILGSIVGGGSTVILFFNVTGVFSLLLKIVFGLLMVIVTFGYQDIRYTFNNVFYLYTISFIVGGVMYLFLDKKIYNYLFLIISFMVICYLYYKKLRKYHCNYNNYYHVNIYYKNQLYKLTGFLDTGNKLFDNYKHRPIILIDKNIKYDINDVIYVSYVSLDNVGVLKCLKPDKIVINKHDFNNYLIGLSKRKIQIDGIDCILHSNMKGRL